MEGNFGLLDKLGESIKGKDYLLLKYILLFAEGDRLIIGEVKDKLVKAIDESERSFFRRIRTLEKEDVLIKTAQGVYKISEEWVTLFDIKDLKEWNRKIQKAKTQTPTHNRFK